MKLSSILKAPALVLPLLAYLTLAATVVWSDEIELVEIEPAESTETLEVSTSEANSSLESLRLRPIFRGNVDSESGGTDAFGSVDGFFPIFQTPGQSTFYFHPKLRFDFGDESTIGGNLIVGYRSYSSERDRILGGYLSLDVRDTGESVFPQVGFGFERLGRFDIRANGYVPVGDTSQTVDSVSALTDRTLTDAFFEENRLQLQTLNTVTTLDDVDVALGGFDVEVGGSIFRWNRSGNLELFGGVYYLGGDDVSAVGGRGRVALTPTDGLQFGVGIQGDEVFGTRVFFNATAQLPHPKAIRPTEEETAALEEAGPVFARMDDAVARNDSVVVDRQREQSTGTVEALEAAINPETGSAWRFIHVEGGVGAGDGSFENPLAQVSDAVALTDTAGNDVVFVDAGSNPGLNGFVVPDNVQVLSSGPVQTLDTQVSEVELPGSGTGIEPLINGIPGDPTGTFSGNLLTFPNMVVLGDNSVVSGFEVEPSVAINPATGDPWRFIHVASGGSSDGTVEDPFGLLQEGLDAASGDGNDIVYVVAGDGSEIPGFTIPDNVQVLSSGVTQMVESQVSGDGGSTFEGMVSGAGTGELPLVNSTVTMGNRTTLSGFEVQSGEDKGIYALNVSDVTIDRNQISTTGDYTDSYGIHVVADSGTVNNNTVITGNTIATDGAEAAAIRLEVESGSELNNSTISGNDISTSGDYSYGVDMRAFNNSSIRNLTMSGNAVTTTGYESYAIQINTLLDSTLSDTNITGNTLSTNDGYAPGLSVSSRFNSEIANTTISGNTVTTSGYYSYGIQMGASLFSSTISNTSISDNRISTQGVEGARGIYIEANEDSTIDQTTISDNTVSTNGGSADGLRLNSTDGGSLENTTISGNAIATQDSGSAVSLRTRGGGTINDIAVASNTISGLATFGNSPIEVNANGTIDGLRVTNNSIVTSNRRVFLLRATSPGTIVNTIISGNTITAADGVGLQVFSDGGSIRGLTIVGNTLSAPGNASDAIILDADFGGEIDDVLILDNTIEEAGRHSVRLSANNASLCIAEFTGNNSVAPATTNAFGADLLLDSFNGGVLNFVDLDEIDVNNIGFDDIQVSFSPPVQVPACP